MAESGQVVQGRRNKLLSLVGNTISLVTNDMVNRIITFVIYALIARYLGAYEFGQMSITLTIFYLLQSLAPVGLKILLIREISRDKENSGIYLVSGSLAAFFSSLAALILLLGFLAVMQYSTDTLWIILIISIGLIPYSLSAVCEAVLQSHEKVRLITIANVPIGIARGFAAYFLLSNGFNLTYIGMLFIVSFLITLLAEWVLILRYVTRPQWVTGKRNLWIIWKASLAFLGLQAVIAITGSILPIFLSKTVGEEQLGFFNAANQLLAPILLVCQSIVMSLFPRMCARTETGVHGLRNISERLLEILVTFSIPMVVGLYFFAGPALMVLYNNNSFYISQPVLQIMVWTLVFRSITSVLGRILLAAHREKNLISIVSFEAIITIILSFIFIPRFSIIGAAIVGVIVSAGDISLHILAVDRIVDHIGYSSILWKPALASILMSLWIIWNQSAGINFWLIIFTSMCLYLILWLLLGILENGSWLKLQQHYRVR